MLTLRGLTFDAAAPRIIVPLFARSLGALRPLAAAADADPAAEVVELRLDPLPEVDFSAALALVRSLTDKPLIVTIRTKAEGGELALMPDTYAAHCRALLAQGGVEGSASLSLADLTGDGVPELVYIWGGGGTGAWEDNCRVFDLSTGEEYPIILDPELMLSQVRAERLERREDHLIYQVTGPGGQSGEAALWCPESDQEPEGGPALGQISLIRMNETGDALEWTASLTLEGPPVLYGNSLGELTAVLEFSPSLRAFTAAPPWGMVLYPLE